ncbi:hypothetical protein ABIB00_006307 [Bradyrhizobium sp. LB14.3]
MNPQITIHVRFAPNGRVIQISERPARLTPDQWFDVLRDRRLCLSPTVPGRGVFRLTRAAVDAFKQETVTPA